MIRREINMLDRIKLTSEHLDVYTVELGDELRVYNCYWDTDKGHTLILIECGEHYEIRLVNEVLTSQQVVNLTYKYIEEREEITK